MLPIIPLVSGLISVVPSIAKWIGGDKAAEAAERITDIAKSVTGLDDPKDAVNAVIKDPELLVKFKMHLSAVEADLDKAYLLDRQDARMQHKHSYMPAVLSTVLTLGLLAFTAALMSVELPEGNVRLIDTVFGSYLTAWLGSIAYWFGTTRGSADKNKLMR